MIRWGMCLSLAVALSACSSAKQKCVPGESVACVGPAGCQGGQACNANGTGYGACLCGSGGGSGGGAGGGGGGAGGGGGGGAGGGSGGGGGGGAMGNRETWVADQILYPANPSQATADGFDLDQDGMVDNALGAFFVAVGQAAPSLSLQNAADDAVNRGTVVQLVETLTGGATSVAFLTGTPAIAPCTDVANPTTCGQHLNGTTSFSADAGVNPALTGSGTAAAFAAGPGTATLQLPLFGGAPVSLTLVLAQASFSRTGTTLSGKVGGAIPKAEVDTVVLPSLLTWSNTAIARDCPTPTSCLSGSDGAQLEALFDADHDGTVTTTELMTHNLVSTLLSGDVDTTGGSTPNAVSAGFGYHLVGAVF